MKNGETADLLAMIAETGMFPMSEAEIRDAMLPEHYTGRCAEQVDSFLSLVDSVIGEGTAHAPELSV